MGRAESMRSRQKRVTRGGHHAHAPPLARFQLGAKLHAVFTFIVITTVLHVLGIRLRAEPDNQGSDYGLGGAAVHRTELRPRRVIVFNYLFR